MFVSVVLPSHNPRRDYLDRCLEGLRRQSLEPGQWELIVVDNQSTPPLSESIDVTWAPNAQIVREETLGLTPARLCGIRLSKGDLIVFVDDDNLLDADFLSVAADTARAKPHLGAWSGQCRPEFESQPPEWTRRYWGNLVIREFDKEVWSNMPRLAESMPCGAGLCVRREVALHYLHLHDAGQRRFQLDRAGDSLVSGGDNDLAACACDIGLGVGLIPTLKLTHIIPQNRLTKDYITRLTEGIYTSAALLDWQRGVPVRSRSAARRVLDFAREIRAGEPHRSILRAARRGHDKAIQLLREQRP